MKSAFFTILTLLIFIRSGAQQPGPEWDKITSGKWGKPFRQLQLHSSADQSLQQAWMYTTTSAIPQPLVVSLHTWNGDFSQEDPVAAEAMLRNWNYIHPDFRGANTKPEACGSNLVLSDISDAIRYMISTGLVDTSAIHVVGVSGGGYTALMAYMLLDEPVRTFSAWVPLSDLNNWYRETQARGLKYANDLEKVATVDGQLKLIVLNERSPLQLPCTHSRIKNRELQLYTGIHDGYTGSVPVSHTLLFFNKAAACLQPGKPADQIPDADIISLLARRTTPYQPGDLTVYGRKIHYRQQLPGLSVTVFEGGHEMLAPAVLSLLPGQAVAQQLRIVTIGDSNGALPYGWPAQLRKLLPFANLQNFSMAGNTIGFDNLGQEKLNTLRNIEKYLTASAAAFKPGASPDFVFIGLGTNDTKDIFSNRQDEVPEHLNQLISSIGQYYTARQQPCPVICILAAPPLNELRADTAKYKGCSARIVRNNRKFAAIAGRQQVLLIDPYETIRHTADSFIPDGIHLNPAGQFICASRLAAFIQNRQ